MVQEPWDYETFVAHYNAVVDEHPGSWYYDRGGAYTPEKLKTAYGLMLCATLREFAEWRFEDEQFSSGET